MKIVGYARVSTEYQSLDMQVKALKAAGCEKIYSESKSGKNMNRPQLRKMQDELESGDKVVVYKLDRLGRSTKDLLKITEQFEKDGIAFSSVVDNIDTSSAIGKAFFTIMAAFAQLERDTTSERVKDGLKAARERGKQIGRASMSEQKRLELHKRALSYKESGMNISAISREMGVSRQTVYTYLGHN